MAELESAQLAHGDASLSYLGPQSAPERAASGQQGLFFVLSLSTCSASHLLPAGGTGEGWLVAAVWAARAAKAMLFLSPDLEF